MGKRKKAQPWDAVFERVRAVYRPQFIYPPKPTAMDLDAAEGELNFKFPFSYRAFAQEYGLGGNLHVLPEVLPLARHPWREKTEWYQSVLEAVSFYRTFDWGQGFWEPDAALLAFLRRVVVFALDSGYHDWVFDPLEVTNANLCEYRIYDINRSTEVTPIAASFDEWLIWIDENYRFEDEDEEEEPSEPEFPPVYKPNSPLVKPMDYNRDKFPNLKECSTTENVALWLSFNHNTVRDLALAIRDHGQTGAFPILADALEEAGCTNADMLDSCRHGDPDIDGVWVLQVLLGKA